MSGDMTTWSRSLSGSLDPGDAMSLLLKLTHFASLTCDTHHPASLPYSSVTLLVSHAPLNYLGFFEPYVAFVFVIFIQGGLKTGKNKSGGL